MESTFPFLIILGITVIIAATSFLFPVPMPDTLPIDGKYSAQCGPEGLAIYFISREAGQLPLDSIHIEGTDTNCTSDVPYAIPNTHVTITCRGQLVKGKTYLLHLNTRSLLVRC